jgi:hypothetical protein
MKSRLIHLLLVFTLAIFSAQSVSASNNIVKKDVIFVVRKPDSIKNIASRFHVSIKTLRMINPPPVRKRLMVYAGKKITIPVWLIRKTDIKGASDFNVADYKLDLDSLDIYVREDFLSMTDVEADTVRRIAIDKEINKIDRKITNVNHSLDSIEEVGMHTLSNKEIRRMPMDRARSIGNFTSAAQIDTLVQLKSKLTEERSKIDVRMADYDYLIENAGNKIPAEDVEDTRTIQIRDWAGDPDKTASPAAAGKKQ